MRSREPRCQRLLRLLCLAWSLMALSGIRTLAAATGAAEEPAGCNLGGTDVGTLLPLLLLVTAAVARRALAGSPVMRTPRRAAWFPRR